MSSFSKFKKFDILGLEMGFEYQNSTRYKTWTGSCLSYTAVLATIIISFIFGREVYQRKIPIISVDEIFEPSHINLKDFKFFINLVGSYQTNALNVSDYLDMKIESRHYNISTTTYDESLRMIPCTPDYFDTYYDLAGISASYNVSMCPNLTLIGEGNYFFQNPAFTYNSSTIVLYFGKCNSTQRTCPSNLDQIFSGFKLNFNYINTYVDNSNYTNPIKYYTDAISVSMSQGILKRDYISFTNDIYLSDNGWIFEDIYQNTFICLSNYRTDVSTILTTNPSYVYIIYLDTGNVTTQTSRSYMKIQDLFAKIGGILNCFLILVSILSYHYIYFNYCMDIYERLNIKTNIIEFKEKLMNSNAQIKEIFKTPDKFKKNVSNKISNDALENPFTSKDNKNVDISLLSVQKYDIIKKKISNNELRDNKIKITEEAPINESNVKNLITNDNLLKAKTIAIKHSSTSVKYNNLVGIEKEPTEKTNSAIPSNFSYCEYLFSLLCCSTKISNKYKNSYKKVNLIMNINNYIDFMSEKLGIYK